MVERAGDDRGAMAMLEAETNTPLKRVGRRRQTLADLAYQELMEAIIFRRLRPGDPLGLDQLAAQLGMSRTPVNLALSRLHAEGLVSYNEHLGFLVRVLTAKDVRDIYDLRLVCELHAIEGGLPTAETADLAAIAVLHQQIEASTDWATADAFRRFWELDGQFHQAIVHLSDNAILLEWFAKLHYHIHAARLGLQAPQAQPFQQMLEEHAAIVAALDARDVAAARAALRRHIVRSRDVTLARLAALSNGAAPDDPNGLAR
jgi:DNA-binding GntR family transcriptional regulator